MNEGRGHQLPSRSWIHSQRTNLNPQSTDEIHSIKYSSSFEEILVGVEFLRKNGCDVSTCKSHDKARHSFEQACWNKRLMNILMTSDREI